ncbi:hypothetical protein FUA48_16185 [Flavobacterium alkalisoli]|uniref:Uncharacterized protein n=1 Tax=Flavobacterium alkalisoli TaxID=2602769 RepID=A0A5B9FXI0_9FLAO|nr:hypothetical protein [Flavobacterium alkalisoli]QEE51059.1 hypothetical protein FUA48_16185 [Flavobacterium alkalisoli]
MKLKIELSIFQLAIINELIADNLPIMSRGLLKSEKSAFYLMSQVADKLLKKAIDKRVSDKKFKISLQYYEAFALHQFLLTFIDYTETDNRRITRDIIGIINQKLA